MGDEIKKRIKYINEIIKTSRTSTFRPDSSSNIENVQSLGPGGEQC